MKMHHLQQLFSCFITWMFRLFLIYIVDANLLIMEFILKVFAIDD